MVYKMIRLKCNEKSNVPEMEYGDKGISKP